MDDMEAPSVGCVSHTLQLAVHEGLLSQRSVTDSPANTRKVVGQCYNSIYSIYFVYIIVYTLFQQNFLKNPIKGQLGCRYFDSYCSCIIQENIS